MERVSPRLNMRRNWTHAHSSDCGLTIWTCCRWQLPLPSPHSSPVSSKC